MYPSPAETLEVTHGHQFLFTMLLCKAELMLRFFRSLEDANGRWLQANPILPSSQGKGLV